MDDDEIDVTGWSKDDDRWAEEGRKCGEDLLGTCNSLHNTKWDGMDQNMRFCVALDETAWCCQGCDWWCEPGEINDHDMCSECQEEEETD